MLDIGRLVSLGLTPYSAYTCDLSTSWSGRDLSGRPNLGVGFGLRCLQPLSAPDLATQQCPWRDNWYTIDPDLPVLSY